MLLLFLLAHALGLITSLWALMSIRTPQGTVAWLLALNTLPWVAVPAFWFLGRRRFEGYRITRRDEDSRLRKSLARNTLEVQPHRVTPPDRQGAIRAVEGLAALPVLSGNDAELLIDGEAIFESLFEGIERARSYILIQFYIVKDDRIGRELQDRLIQQARKGIRILFLYDEIGSFRLPESYAEKLRDSGVKVRPFHSTRGPGNRFQLNFRNHRKVMVVDGREGWVGGINLGDEYLGRDPVLGRLRETHLRIEGPAVLGLQLSFLEDWHWATDEVPELRWEPEAARSGADLPVLILPSGPADPMETGSLMVQHALHMADERVWISTPYFVPDGGVMAALRLAALRGVDVRILIPDRADHRLVGLAGSAFLPELLEAGVRFFRYEEGFFHGKALLLDQVAAAVGTLNLDNRSFRLNFEITALVLDPGFAGEVEAMFLEDFRRSRPVTLEELTNRPLWRQASARFAALFAPIL